MFFNNNPIGSHLCCCAGIGNCSAIFLFPLLMYYFKLGVSGAAISSVISQYVLPCQPFDEIVLSCEKVFFITAIPKCLLPIKIFKCLYSVLFHMILLMWHST